MTTALPALFSKTYQGRKVLVTGHTGFKGSWLVLWLKLMGAQITGLSLNPDTQPNHWDLLSQHGLSKDVQDQRGDVRDAAAVRKVLDHAEPEIVFHLAAQPLVRRSYREPLETWSTNVMGTANVLEACRQTPSVKAIVVITTDKCYENSENGQAFQEEDRLGGHDPYSASKAGTELVVASYRASFFSNKGTALLASARAGNVIGGGDWSEDRLIPDLMRAVAGGPIPEIRYPQATRPWQHVLESLSGYLLLGQRLLAGDASCARAWNFGPTADDQASVARVLDMMQDLWPSLEWDVATQAQPHEAQTLQLDSRRALQDLAWQPIWHLRQGVAATADWYRAYLERQHLVTEQQLRDYITAATTAGVVWTQREGHSA